MAGTLLAATLVALGAQRAGAVFPGPNGLIAYDAPGSGGSLAIWTIHPDGSGATQIASEANADVVDPAWSPDGTRIAFVTGSGHIAVMDANGGNVKDLTPNDPPGGVVDGSPTWSPDGTKIAFSRVNFSASAPEYDIWVMSASDGSGQTNLTPCPTPGSCLNSIEPAWDPDGSKIAFVRGNPEEIYTISADGTNLTQVSNTPFDASDPSWSPDGSKLVFSFEDTDLYVVNANGSGQTQLTNTPDVSEGASSWSPDGTSIVTRGQDPSTDVNHLYLVNPTSGAETLIQHTAGADLPDWQAVVNHLLTVTLAGSGSGKVTSLPLGINCSSGSCSHGFAPGTTVKLTATPTTLTTSGGSVFTGWSGGGCSGPGTCTVTLNADTHVTATFQPAVTLTVDLVDGQGADNVQSSPAGINCGGASSSCSAAFAKGTIVTLTATGDPDHGSVFTGWSPSSCSGLGQCPVTLNGNLTVNASFGALPPPVGGGVTIPPLFWGPGVVIEESIPAKPAEAVSCATFSLCVAGGQGFLALTTTSGTDPSATRAWQIVGTDSGNTVLSVSCPSGSFCAAGDSAGNILTTTDPPSTSGSWQVTHVDGSHHITGISCATSTNCAAVDDAGDVIVSTDPTGGASAWAVKPIDTHPLNAVSCPQVNECVAVDGAGQRFEATGTGSTPAVDESWTHSSIDSGHSLTGVSCVQSLCVAVDNAGDVITNTDSGNNGWAITPVRPEGLNAISCSTPSFCTTGGDGAATMTSTDPAGPASTWQVGGGSRWGLHGVSCLTAPLPGLGGDTTCVAVSTDGASYSGTIPILGISRFGTGTGSVAISSSGKTCPSTCQELETADGSVTLTATPASGDAVSGWYVGCSSAAADTGAAPDVGARAHPLGPGHPGGLGCSKSSCPLLTCTVTMSGSQYVGVVFSPSPVSTGGGGGVTVTTGTVSGTFTCKVKTACSGTVTYYSSPSGGSAHDTRAAKSNKVVVARGTFKIPGQKRRKITVRLTAAGKALARKHRLKSLTAIMKVRTGNQLPAVVVTRLHVKR